MSLSQVEAGGYKVQSTVSFEQSHSFKAGSQIDASTRDVTHRIFSRGIANVLHYAVHNIAYLCSSR